MSDNPARELAELLEEWSVVPQDGTVYSARGAASAGEGDLDLWRLQMRAVRLLAEVDDALRSMEASGRRVDHHVRSLPIWSEGIFAPNLAWNTQVNAQLRIIPQTAIDQLHGLADFIESTVPGKTIGPAERVSIRKAVAELIELLSGDDVEFDPASRRYIFELLSSVQRLADEHLVTGTADLVRRINELNGALDALTRDLEDAGADSSFIAKVRKSARGMYPYARFGAVVGLSALDAAANLKAITGI